MQESETYSTSSRASTKEAYEIRTFLWEEFPYFKGNGKAQLMFWNQGAHKLFMAEIPDNPRAAKLWPLTEILDTSKVHTAIKQEGMAAFDVDGDGQKDLLAGLYWFKHTGGNSFRPIRIADHPGRIADVNSEASLTHGTRPAWTCG
jgi:hypothetical protein